MLNEEIEDDVVFAKFINYMQKALLHKKLNYIRDNKRILELECSIEGLENTLYSEEQKSLDCFECLSEKEQEVIRLHIEEKLTYNQISKIMKLQPESVRKIKYRAIKKLESRRYYGK